MGDKYVKFSKTEYGLYLCRMEDIPVTNIYFMISWVALAAAVLLLVIGLWNAEMALSEKGFYMMGFTLSLFSAITVQKNTRDLLASDVSGLAQSHAHKLDKKEEIFDEGDEDDKPVHSE